MENKKSTIEEIEKTLTKDLNSQKPNVDLASTVRDEACALQSQQVSLIREQIKDIPHYRALREEYAGKVFWFMCVWSGLAFLIIIAKGVLNAFGINFDISDVVLTTLVGGTTVSVIGLVGFMMQGLFHSKK